MDKKKGSPPSDKKKSTTTTTTKTTKHEEKKDENILVKAAHSIRDKVHGLTDEVKDKAHHLTHSDDSKKDKDHKKSDTKLKASSKIPKSSDKDSSDDEKDKDPTAPPGSSEPPGDKAAGDAAASSKLPPSKSPGLPSGGDTDAATSAPPPSNPASKATEPPSGGDSKPPGEKKDDTPAASSGAPGNAGASKSSGEPSSEQKPAPSAGPDAENKSPAGSNSNDKVHISFDGIQTVDDLLERIDQAIESAQIIVDNGSKKAQGDKPAIGAANAEAEKKPAEDEPIRVKFNEVHNMEDLLGLVNNQPGHRKVVLEDAPGQSNTVSIKKNSIQSVDDSKDKNATTTVKKEETPSSATKTTEKKEETPNSVTKTTEKKEETPTSSSTTKKEETPSSSTKVETTSTPTSSETTVKTTDKSPQSNDASSPEGDQIHVNIENIRSVDDLLDRVDEAVQKVPVIIDTKPRPNPNSSKPKEDDQADKKDDSDALKFQKKDTEIKQDSDGKTIHFIVMSKRFFEGAQHAARYAATRPSYPPVFMKKIIDFLSIKYKGTFDYAADVGCGSGQSTELLSPYFKKVYGYDVSENQVREARAKNKISNIEYKVSSNNAIPHEKQSLCLITAAQAAHWFDLKQFYSEVHRTLKPMGVLAVYGYALPEVANKQYLHLNDVIQQFYQKMIPYFPPDRAQIDNRYADIVLPFEEKIRDESAKIEYEWNLDRFVAYVSSWSGYVNYMRKHPDRDVLIDFREELAKAMKSDAETELLKIDFPIFALLGRKTTT
ncbi:unnamed protein product [Adineta ricciae]|uniref:Methyltransferase type 11 domain-containing protein n=1 Tax=Adineta ricciae TaxID=249248 RepID=A0A814HHW8_ADIRI|nr:unnamed protein product [Adineta ricciae]